MAGAGVGVVAVTREEAARHADRWMDHMHVHKASDPSYPAMTDVTCCPSCGEPDLIETGTPVIETSGHGPNHEFGVAEYWWEGWLKCARCGELTPWADSSL